MILMVVNGHLSQWRSDLVLQSRQVEHLSQRKSIRTKQTQIKQKWIIYLETLNRLITHNYHQGLGAACSSSSSWHPTVISVVAQETNVMQPLSHQGLDILQIFNHRLHQISDTEHCLFLQTEDKGHCRSEEVV